MALMNIVRLVLVVLVGFVGSSSVSAQQSKPVEVRSIVPPAPGSLGEQLAQQEAEKQKPAVEAEADEEPQTTKARLANLKEYRKATKARLERLTDEQLNLLIGSESEGEILALAQEIEQNRAKERAARKVRRYDTPALRQVRNALRDIEKERKEAEDWDFESKRDTALSCGNPDDEADVYIHPTVGKIYEYPQHSKMTIVNTTDKVVQIRRVAGARGTAVVEKMCPNGTITLYERRILASGFQMPVSYIAVGVGGGKAIMSESPTINVQPCMYRGCTAEFSDIWEIK